VSEAALGTPRALAGGRVPAIDALRGIAVFAVFLSHMPFSKATFGTDSQESVFPPALSHVLHYGQYGVHLFLVLSGFCIHMQAARQADATTPIQFGSFWRRRLFRLYPPYLITLLCCFGALYLTYGVLLHHGPTLAAKFGYASASQLGIDLVILLLLAQNLNGASARVGNGPFWTLALEEQLYMLYFLLLWLRRQFGWKGALGVAFGVTLLFRCVGLLVAPDSWFTAWFTVGPARWFEWTLGALAVEAHHGHVRLPKWATSPSAGAILLATAVAVHQVPISLWAVRGNPIDDMVFGVAFFVIVNAAIRSSFVSGGVVGLFAKLGIFSYSMYLVHNPIMVATKQVALRIGLPLLVTGALRATLPFVGAYLFYRVVESKFLHAARQKPRG
jgi:peptidoglycan/LPS O-acetylase OafA/YrhL